MNNVAKTRYELGVRACPGGANEPLYEGKTHSKAEINTLWRNIG